MNPKVSIIVPVYNSATFLPELFSKLQAQDSDNWECICVDNLSVDNSVELIRMQAAKDHRFRLEESKTRGVSFARNLGLKAALGEFIQFLDADDYLATSKIRIHSDYLDKHPATGLVFSDAKYYRHQQPNQFITPPWSKDFIAALSGSGTALLEELLKGNRLVISAPMFRQDAYFKTGTFDENMQFNEDWDFWLRMVKSGITFQFIDQQECLSYIRLHESSSSRNLGAMYASELNIYIREAKDKNNDNSVRSTARRYFYKTWLEIALRKVKGDKISLKGLPKWM